MNCLTKLENRGKIVFAETVRCSSSRGRVAARPRYVVEDLLFRPHRATNCIHALSDLGLTTSLLHTLGSHGREASWKVVYYLAPWIQNPSQTHKNVLKAFGLGPYEERIRFLDYQADAILDFVGFPQETQAATETRLKKWLRDDGAFG